MQEALRALKHKLFWVGVKPIPFKARQAEYSVNHPSDDDPAKPSARLQDFAIRASDSARNISLSEVSNRIQDQTLWPDFLPGEQYKLLAGLVSVCKPKLLIEIGTFTGLSELSILQTLPIGSRIVTFDIVPWDRVASTCLKREDFEDGSLTQIIDEVSDPTVIAKHASNLDLHTSFLRDGPKDGAFEKIFMQRLTEISLIQKSYSCSG